MSTALIREALEADEGNACMQSKTKIVCTLGPKSRSVPVLEELLTAGMSVARFNFSHGSHEYHQETLGNLRQACRNTRLMCATLLDTKGPEIRTGTLKDGKPISLEAGQRVVLSTQYSTPGGTMANGVAIIKLSYPSLARDVSPGCSILIADGSIVLRVDECDEAAASVGCTCLNSSTLGERKNCNLPGVIVDLPTITDKDRVDIVDWGVENDVDFIAASFVRKGSDVHTIRSLVDVYEGGRNIKIISKVENQEGATTHAAPSRAHPARGGRTRRARTRRRSAAQRVRAGGRHRIPGGACLIATPARGGDEVGQEVDGAPPHTH